MEHNVHIFLKFLVFPSETLDLDRKARYLKSKKF